MEPYRFAEGTAPLLVSMPHVGTALPQSLAERLTPEAQAVPDTDWHVDRLYDFLDALGASTIQASYSRYLIDLNRTPDGKPLYPGASETELCPSSTFADQPLYRDGGKPHVDEIAERRERYWRPYHARLAEELERLKARHGRVLLWDAHSIRSEVPRFFAGRLPDLNLGTGDGTSCDPALAALLEQRAAASGYRHALNGRFKGGYITRHYGRPAEGVQAVQLELSQITYMNEDPPFAFDEARAAKIRPVLRGMIEAALAWLAR